MEKDEVPQDDAGIFEGKFKVVKYATDLFGNYIKVPTLGWEPENIALSQAWEEINSRIELVRKRVLKGEVSPIAFYMEKQMMDIKMLSDHTGFWSFTIKRHLKPSVFGSLSPDKLEKYARTFRISIEDLKRID